MKKTFIALILLIALPAQAAEKCAQNRSVAAVDGMVCDFCAQGLIKTFGKNDSVDNVKVDLTSKTVTIDAKPGRQISDKEINRLIDYSGYKLVKVDHLCAKS